MMKQGSDNDNDGHGGGGGGGHSSGEGVVQTNTLQKQQQQQQQQVSLSNHHHHPTTSVTTSPQSSQQQQGITTITAFKRPNHKVGIIFTRQSSSSPDVAIIARILPESIFAQHDEAERREQARLAAVKGLVSPSALKGVTRGLEGSEVIAVNGVP
eukprot:scaffold13949_cov80-Skeletonema_menzelii.AAC.1